MDGDYEVDYFPENYDELLERYFLEQDMDMEKQAFEGKRLCGKSAHAYNAKYDNLKMLSLYRERKSYRQIASAIGCSPNTVRNRLNKLLGK